MHRGIPTTTPARTLVDIAVHVDRETLERAVAVAERERLVTRSELAALVELHRGRPGITAVRELVEKIAGPNLTRSEAERRFLALIRRARLPAPHTNVRVEEFEIDFFWPDHDLAVEVDGYRYHGSRVRFEADRQRATRLASLGIHVVPVTWRQIVDDELVTAVQLAQALTRSGAAAEPGRTRHSMGGRRMEGGFHPPGGPNPPLDAGATSERHVSSAGRAKPATR